MSKSTSAEQPKRRSERLLNLTIALLSARRFITKAELRTSLEAYRELSDSAFERQFERDKNDLREAGLPIIMGSNSALFDDEVGYRIPRSNFELPALTFDSEELSALGAAAQVWQQASAAKQTISALTKLRAAGVDPDVDRLAALQPRINADEPAFEVSRQAVTTRRRLRFHYRGSAQERHIEPWKILFRRGAWYLLGNDLDRRAPRMFKMSRMSDVPKLVGRADAYQLPNDVDLQELSRQLEPSAPDSTALLAIRGNKAPALRRNARRVDPPTALPEGFSCYELSYAADSDFVADVAAASPDVAVLAPRELRDQVVAHLQAVMEVTHGRS